ncbi:MAG: hypothetical protein OXN15_10015 [Chloroflexota bacterium]|nr:hypothetical protein [Chloroflexota bacterium]MDE2969439.1 hypothetical protein [Chloroflexota bacterium]
MVWIKVILEDEAEGELKEAYERMREINAQYEDTPVPPRAQGMRIVGPPQLASLNPLSMLYGRQFMMHVMRGPSRVTPAEREMVATVTSLASNCRY